MDEIVCFAVDKNEDLPIQEVIRWLKLAADMSPGQILIVPSRHV